MLPNLLSVVIPCYNEENTIELIVNEINNVNIYNIKKEIIIIDDASTDTTRDKLKELCKKNKNIKLIFNDHNVGKGGSIKKGFLASKGGAVIVQDADREYDPEDYKKMIILFLNDRADIVFGSRFSGGEPRRLVYTTNNIANKLLTKLSSLLSGLHISDVNTCYILFRGDWIREKADLLKSKKFGFNPEIVALISTEKERLRICEVGISYFARTKKEGKKIGVIDGIKSVLEIFYYNIIYRLHRN